MKPIKTTCLALALLMTVGLAACNKDKNAKAPKDVLSPEVQSGAKVERRVNENGHEEFSYENPDGSAGGGVELD